MEERFWTVPNLLSMYRIAAAPAIAVCICIGRVHWFVALFTLSLLSDIGDGWIARQFNLRTKIGARLDSFADLLTYLLGIWGVVRFHWADISAPARAAAFFTFLATYALLMLTGLVKFRRQPSLHTYGFKVSAYLQSACLLTVFLFGFNAPFYYFTLAWGCLACLEEVAILLILKEPQSDVKGLYWVLKERRSSS
jgi:CDP-diacylglycerol--glycerol-3-phosphate 3-phosphatidyltransferase